MMEISRLEKSSAGVSPRQWKSPETAAALQALEVVFNPTPRKTVEWLPLVIG
jgi:hypothetical protein